MKNLFTSLMNFVKRSTSFACRCAKRYPIYFIVVLGVLLWWMSASYSDWKEARDREKYEHDRQVLVDEINKLQQIAAGEKIVGKIYAEEAQKLSVQVKTLSGRVESSERGYKAARDSARAAGAILSAKNSGTGDTSGEKLSGSDAADDIDATELCKRSAAVGVPCFPSQN